MIILGIDPGLETVGYGVVKQDNDFLSLIDFGVIHTSSKEEIVRRFVTIQEDLQQIIDEYNPHLAAVETLYFEKNVKTAINVAQARGVIISTLAKKNITLYEPTPLEVKMNVTGDGRADKIQIQTMVKRILNLSELPKPDDAADALAIAIWASAMKKY